MYTINRIGNKKRYLNLIKDKTFVTNDEKLKSFLDYGSISDDLRMIIELISWMQDILSKKYAFIKFPKKYPKDADYAKSILDTENTLLVRCIWFTIVVTYAKPFNKNYRGNKNPFLQLSNVFKDLNEKLIAIHHEILNLRNQYIAHYGIFGEEYTYALMVKDKKEEERIFSIPFKKKLPPIN